MSSILTARTEPREDSTPGDARIKRRALPAWVYRDARMSRLEHERLFQPSWQIVCHQNSIPRPGDYASLQVGPDSLVVVRDRDGGVRGFVNVCRHRAARLLEGSGHCAGRITCPYHGWSYRLDGSLLAVPSAESYGPLDKDELGLLPVRVETLLGFVFVSLSQDAPPLATLWGDLVTELAPYRCEEMVPLGPIWEETWEVDWKVAAENYLDAYHIPVGHPGLNRLTTPVLDRRSGQPGLFRARTEIRSEPSTRWSERMYQQLVLGVAPHLPATAARSWTYYSMLPNIGLDVFPEQMDFFQVLPLGPGRCLIRSALFGLPEAGDRRLRAVRWLGARINAQVNREDRELCLRVQRGVASDRYVPGPLSQIEQTLFEFHELLRERIPEARQPLPPPEGRAS